MPPTVPDFASGSRSPRPNGCDSSGSKRWWRTPATAWDARAHIGDLEAVRHRSRITEAAALTDPVGLGAHRVLVFDVG